MGIVCIARNEILIDRGKQQVKCRLLGKLWRKIPLVGREVAVKINRQIRGSKKRCRESSKRLHQEDRVD